MAKKEKASEESVESPESVEPLPVPDDDPLAEGEPDPRPIEELAPGATSPTGGFGNTGLKTFAPEPTDDRKIKAIALSDDTQRKTRMLINRLEVHAKGHGLKPDTELMAEAAKAIRHLTDEDPDQPFDPLGRPIVPPEEVPVPTPVERTGKRPVGPVGYSEERAPITEHP